MPTKFVERIAVEIEGDGDAVLLIHGLGGTSNVWSPILPAIARCKVVRFDLPGSGRSDRVEGPLSIARFVQAALRAASAAGVERAHVCGHSLGTIVAFHLAIVEPRFVRSLAQFGPLLAPPDPARAALRARAAKAREGAAAMAEIAEQLLASAVSAETRARRSVATAYVRESLMRQLPDGYARTCEALAEAQPIDPAKVACPTLLVTGDEDQIAPVHSVRQIGERLPNARVEVLPRCGHWTMIEQPESCRDLLERFLSQRF